MENDAQAVLFADVRLWRPAEPEAPQDPLAAGDRPPRLQPIQRNQLIFRAVDVEQLIGPEHPARAIWELIGQRDLTGFYDPIEAVTGVAGRPAYDPRLLISLWIYAYMDGTPSARQIARQFDYHPAYQWLTAATTLSAHTLSDFRTQHEEALKNLITQILGLLAEENLVDLKQVTQDGTKVRASAGADTFRRQTTLERHLEEARERIEEWNSGDSEEISQRSLQARQRAARERLSRLEKAQQELEKIQQTRKAQESEARVSLTDPEARIMKQNDGGYAPSYNVQVTTDAKRTVIVSVAVTQDGGDSEQLQPAMQRVEKEAGQAAQQAIVDGGYTSRGNIVAMAEGGIDLIGPPLDGKVQKETLYQIRGVAPAYRPEAFAFDAVANAYTCPEGKTLRYKTRQVLVGQTKYTYVAEAEDCGACAQKACCCPTTTKGGRSLVRAEDGPEVVAFRAKMETEEAKSTYRKRGAVAEFPNLCIKERYGLRQFSVRGLQKVRSEALWVCLTYNIQQWIRLCWRKNLAVAS